MLVEIHGAGFANKGAQLMLETAVKSIREERPDARFAIAAGPDRPPRAVGKLGIEFLWPSALLHGRAKKFRPYFEFSNLVGRFVGRNLLGPYGLVTRRDVDALVDISGYAFGDHWGPRPIQNMVLLSGLYRKKNKPVILLPQMFGPFERPEVRNAFSQMAANCSLIFARDKASLEAARHVAPRANLKLAPDITIRSKKTTNSGSGESSPEGVCLVPNIRVLDTGKNRWVRHDYLKFFEGCAQHVHAAGLSVTVVIHDSIGADAELARELFGRIKGNSTLLDEEDPTLLKHYLSKARFVIGSRYHSLVAALSTNVPVVAVGWAHKYTELLADYGQSDFNIATPANAAKVDEMLGVLLDDNSITMIRKRIREENELLNGKCHRLWQDVIANLGPSR